MGFITDNQVVSVVFFLSPGLSGHCPVDSDGGTLRENGKMLSVILFFLMDLQKE